MRAIVINESLLQDVEREVATAVLCGSAASMVVFQSAFNVVKRLSPGDEKLQEYRSFVTKEALKVAKRYVIYNHKKEQGQ